MASPPERKFLLPDLFQGIYGRFEECLGICRVMDSLAAILDCNGYIDPESGGFRFWILTDYRMTIVVQAFCLQKHFQL